MQVYVLQAARQRIIMPGSGDLPGIPHPFETDLVRVVRSGKTPRPLRPLP